jgi:hypothetical protein
MGIRKVSQHERLIEFQITGNPAFWVRVRGHENLHFLKEAGYRYVFPYSICCVAAPDAEFVASN